MDAPTRPKATIVTSTEIGQLASEPLGTLEGVVHKVMWRNDTSIAGVLTVAAGHRLGLHSHRLNHHHMWVIDGHAVILGTDVGPGTYLHVPHGVSHDIDATASEGCTVFYLYLRPGG
jgi:mannose-6-phosphate isomerase-like protein (cupin superfamily)